MSLDLRLYLVLDVAHTPAGRLVETARAAVAGGATIVQLRDKHGGHRAIVEGGRALLAALHPLGVKLIINDDVEAAEAIRADGVHVGVGDCAPEEVRHRLGSDAIIGYSAGTPAEFAAIDPASVDYLGAGPVFPTATKSDTDAPIGLDGLAAMVRLAGMPVVAIGGLKARHAGEVMATGAAGMAVVTAICAADDPKGAARSLRQAIDAARQERTA